MQGLCTGIHSFFNIDDIARELLATNQIDFFLFYSIYIHLIQICYGITRGRVLSGEFYAHRDYREVNLFAFVYRLFHEVD